MLRQRPAKVVCLVLVLIPSISLAANDCNAVVTAKTPKKTGSGWTLEFEVKTKCVTSTGRFTYTYVDDKGRKLDRSSPSWTPADGQTFVLKDEIAEPGGLKSLTVVLNTVESTKSP